MGTTQLSQNHPLFHILFHCCPTFVFPERILSENALVLHNLLGGSPFAQVVLRSSADDDTKRRPSKESSGGHKESKVEKVKRLLESRHGASPIPPTSPIGDKRLGGRTGHKLAQQDSDDDKPPPPLLSTDDVHRFVLYPFCSRRS
jgi:hypothetical protein